MVGNTFFIQDVNYPGNLDYTVYPDFVDYLPCDEYTNVTSRKYMYHNIGTDTDIWVDPRLPGTMLDTCIDYHIHLTVATLSSQLLWPNSRHRGTSNRCSSNPVHQRLAHRHHVMAPKEEKKADATDSTGPGAAAPMTYQQPPTSIYDPFTMNPWELLGFDIMTMREDDVFTITYNEYKNAYKKAMVKYHPDKAVRNGMDRAEAEKIFKSLSNAHDFLIYGKNNDVIEVYDYHRFILCGCSKPEARAKAAGTYEDPEPPPEPSPEPAFKGRGKGKGKGKTGSYHDDLHYFFRKGYSPYDWSEKKGYHYGRKYWKEYSPERTGRAPPPPWRENKSGASSSKDHSKPPPKPAPKAKPSAPRPKGTVGQETPGSSSSKMPSPPPKKAAESKPMPKPTSTPKPSSPPQSKTPPTAKPPTFKQEFKDFLGAKTGRTPAEDEAAKRMQREEHFRSKAAFPNFDPLKNRRPTTEEAKEAEYHFNMALSDRAKKILEMSRQQAEEEAEQARAAQHAAQAALIASRIREQKVIDARAKILKQLAMQMLKKQMIEQQELKNRMKQKLHLARATAQTERQARERAAMDKEDKRDDQDMDAEADAMEKDTKDTWKRDLKAEAWKNNQSRTPFPYTHSKAYTEFMEVTREHGRRRLPGDRNPEPRAREGRAQTKAEKNKSRGRFGNVSRTKRRAWMLHNKAKKAGKPISRKAAMEAAEKVPPHSKSKARLRRVGHTRDYTTKPHKGSFFEKDEDYWAARNKLSPQSSEINISPPSSPGDSPDSDTTWSEHGGGGGHSPDDDPYYMKDLRARFAGTWVILDTTAGGWSETVTIRLESPGESGASNRLARASIGSITWNARSVTLPWLHAYDRKTGRNSIIIGTWQVVQGESSVHNNPSSDVPGTSRRIRFHDSDTVGLHKYYGRDRNDGIVWFSPVSMNSCAEINHNERWARRKESHLVYDLPPSDSPPPSKSPSKSRSRSRSRQKITLRSAYEVRDRLRTSTSMTRKMITGRNGPCSLCGANRETDCTARNYDCDGCRYTGGMGRHTPAVIFCENCNFARCARCLNYDGRPQPDDSFHDSENSRDLSMDEGKPKSKAMPRAPRAATDSDHSSDWEAAPRQPYAHGSGERSPKIDGERDERMRQSPDNQSIKKWIRCQSDPEKKELGRRIYEEKREWERTKRHTKKFSKTPEQRAEQDARIDALLKKSRIPTPPAPPTDTLPKGETAPVTEPPLPREPPPSVPAPPLGSSSSAPMAGHSAADIETMFETPELFDGDPFTHLAVYMGDEWPEMPESDVTQESLLRDAHEARDRLLQKEVPEDDPIPAAAWKVPKYVEPDNDAKSTRAQRQEMAEQMLGPYWVPCNYCGSRFPKNALADCKSCAQSMCHECIDSNTLCKRCQPIRWFDDATADDEVDYE